MSNKNRKQRVIVYIDGYNLYYGQLSAYRSRYKWLDLQAFSNSFLRPNMVLMQVKYFTAITSTAGSKQRQEIYLKALQSHCDKLQIYYGRFLAKSKRCRSCGAEYTVFEEKKTDVNIACELLNDTHLDRYDCCYVVSGDSDLVPPLKLVKENHPDKHAIIAHPPRRKSTELCEIADGWFAISEQKFKRSLLPETVISSSGNKLNRPSKWR